MKNILVIIGFVLISINLKAQQGGRMGQSGQGMRGGGQRPSAEQILERLDQDGDGKISKSEASEAQRGKLSENFDMLDANSDGYIDIEELDGGAKKKQSGDKRAKGLMKSIDANNDNQLDELEVAASEKLEIKNNFSKIDSDSDGYIIEDELRTYFKDENSSKKKKSKANKD